MHHQPCGFVDHDQRVVFVGDGERDILWLGMVGNGGWNGNRQIKRGGNLGRSARYHRADMVVHRTFTQERLDPFTRQVGECVSQGTIQPLPKMVSAQRNFDD